MGQDNLQQSGSFVTLFLEKTQGNCSFCNYYIDYQIIKEIYFKKILTLTSSWKG